MNNPYIYRGPVRAAGMFFGRGHEINEIVAFLHGNQSVSLVGPRKYGKTSLLFHLTRPETAAQLGLQPDNLLVYLDCEVLGDSEHDQIFGQFAEEISTALEARHLPAELMIEAAINQPTRLSFERAIRKLNQRGLRVVLVLDEFERLSTNANLDVNFFNALRSAAGRYQLVFITASARPLIQLTYSENAQSILSSPFFNIFAPLFLGPLAEEAARQLIRLPAQQAGVEISPATEDFIYQLVGGYPLGLQVACFHTLAVIGELGLPDLNEIEQRTMQELTPHFQYYWKNLSRAEQETLFRVPEATSLVSTDTTLRGILRDLVQKCHVVLDGGLYRYPSRAWAAFVAVQSASATAVAAKAGASLRGMHFGPYEVQESIGRGGMADVYKGYHTRLERVVAIKVLPANLASEADFRRRFEREARAVAALRHPNIVQVYDFGDVDGMYYMVMEYINGRDLREYLRDAGPLTIYQALPIIKDLAGALDYAHSQGVVHRDVKPSNVLLEPHLEGERRASTHDEIAPAYRAVLTDFGIAKMYGGDTAATRTGMIMGTLDFMAPEQIRASGTVDHRADIYALAIMMYDMLTGQLPFKGDNPGALMLAHLQTLPPDPRLLATDLPDQVARALLQALAKNPEERPGSAGELVDLIAAGI